MDKYSLNINDTIIALSTPFGKSGIGIIRLSGNLVNEVIKTFFNKFPTPRVATLVNFINPYDKSILDTGILIFFKKPNSFTGEDIVEFHAHGSPIMLSYIINIIISKLNIRIAFPGEFSSRSFINGKLNLDQAEGILNLIESESLISAKLSSNLIQGFLSKEIENIINLLKNLNIILEANINFSYDDININLIKEIKDLKNKIIKKLENIIYNYSINKIVQNGVKISIVGKPNVGKSTLFNSLINENKSITSSIKGTTRDLVNEKIWINGICFNIIDTAGIEKTKNKLNLLGINKTINEIYKSDHIFYVIDDIKYIENNNFFIKNLINFKKIDFKILNNISFTIIKNKSDINNEKICIIKKNNYNIIYISAKNKLGIDLIINHLKSLIDKNVYNINYIVNQRQIEYINNSLLLLNDINNNDLVIFSKNINFAINNLLKISNKKNITSSNILDEIFSKFCIGK